MALIQGGVPVGGLISPTDSNDVFAVTDPKYQIGGWRECDTLEEMNSIPAQRRRQGMIVSVLKNNDSGEYEYYQLRNDVFTLINFGSNTGSTEPSNPNPTPEVDLSDYYTKEETYSKEDVYKKDETYGKDSLYTKDDLYTKTEIDSKGYQTEQDVLDLDRKYSITKFDKNVTYNKDDLVYLEEGNEFEFFRCLKDSTIGEEITSENWQVIKPKIEVDIDLDNYVDLNSEQEITGVKKFTAVPTTTGVPDKDEELVNLRYVKNKYATKDEVYQNIRFMGTKDNYTELESIESPERGDQWIVLNSEENHKSGSYIYGENEWYYTGDTDINLQAVQEALPFNIYNEDRIYWTSAEYEELDTDKKNNGKMYIIVG